MSANRLTLYLASWQKRMLKDFMPVGYFKEVALKDINKVYIDFGIMKCPASYLIPPMGFRRGDWVMYLTDEQIVQVKEHFGLRAQVTRLNVGAEALDSKLIQFG